MTNSTDELDRLLARTGESQRSSGLERSRAFAIASLEERIRRWPETWGNNLEVLIYSDFFQAPDSAVEYRSLRITIHPGKQENTVITGAIAVLRATVAVDDKSLPEVLAAAKRINLLLGVHTLDNWGNAGIGWWCSIIHGSLSSVAPKVFDIELEKLIAAILALPHDVRQKLESALYWVRDSRSLFRHSYRSDILKVYAAYWNAFECLIDAVHAIKPNRLASRREKQAMIEAFFDSRNGLLTAENIQECFRTIVDTGLRGKAKYALEICFGKEVADAYIGECFGPPSHESLYAIRNSINHGDIDAENPEELIRIQSKLSRLWMIVWRMFGRFIPFAAPIESVVPRRQA
jgi:hypothetical protein